MEFKDLVEKRHSARKFSDKKISKEDLEDMLKTASHAPSWEDSQPWKVYVAIGKTLEGIKQEHLELANKGTIAWTDVKPTVSDDWTKQEDENVAHFSKELEEFTKGDTSFFAKKQRYLYNAQALIYFTSDEKATPYKYYDIGSFAQNLILAAADKGIGTIPAYEIVRFPDSIRKYIDIPKDEKIFMGIALGYPDEDRINEFKPGRMDIDKFVKFSD